MKKIVLFMILFIPIFVKANSIRLDCNSDVVKTNTLSCNIVGNSTDLTIGISLKIRTGKNIIFNSFIPANGWQGNGDNGSVDLYTDKDLKNDFNIGTINFNITSSFNGEDSSISLEQISFYDENGIEQKINNYTKNIRIAASNNNLSSLSIVGGILNPSFNSETTVYSTTINAASIKIEATASNNKAKLSGDIGVKKLSYGNNTFKVYVTSESGSQRIYLVNVIRPSNSSSNNDISNNQTITKSNNANLKTLKINNNSINLEKEILEYRIEVPYTTEKLDIEVIPEDTTSKVQIEKEDNIEVGENKVKVIVTAEDNSTKTYKINVIRKEENSALSSNNNISNIVIDNYDINFDRNKLEYNLKIKYEKKLNINVSLEDTTATYKIEGNEKLNNKSQIRIIVTAEDSSTKTYIINIKNNDPIIKIIFISIYTLLIVINVLRIIFKKRGIL